MDMEIFKYTFGMPETLAIAVVLLLLGRWVKEKIVILKKFFIPAPVVGGLIFSIITLIGHQYNLFEFSFDSQLKSLLMLAFFTTIGFAASIKMLLKGGIQVIIFLLVAFAVSVATFVA